MSMLTTLLTLAAVFSQLSLLAFGGTNAVIPEMQRQVVDLHHWMSAQEFAALFALAQAAPGPRFQRRARSRAPLPRWQVTLRSRSRRAWNLPSHRTCTDGRSWACPRCFRR